MPGVGVTLLIVLLIVDVKKLVSVTVEDECSSVQVALLAPDGPLDGA